MQRQRCLSKCRDGNKLDAFFLSTSGPRPFVKAALDVLVVVTSFFFASRARATIIKKIKGEFYV
jgi:hypothetical protein